MADNKVIFEVITTSKGTKVVQRQTEELAKSVNKADQKTKGLDKTQEKNYGRQKQGVIQTANSTKNFSKLSQTIGGGSSGLVGAYATLAANVFAASAAFNFLRASARFDVLTEGVVALGNQSGRTLSIVADNLREVTGEAISVEEALRSAALGVSGGFGEEELSGLAKIAKGASIALGRDLGDAFDRLTRGAIKLEPEILDELGIMVRLDDAVENYATVLGKSAGSLTQLERRQAFMNAILEQGEIKFGNIAEQVDANPYDKLAAAFADLTRQIGQFVNIAIVPFVTLLANNIGILVASSLLLASTFAKQMVPSLLQGGAAAAAASGKFAQLAKDQKKTRVKSLGPLSEGIGTGSVGSQSTQKELKAIEKSNGKIKVTDKLISSLKRSKSQLAAQEAKRAKAGNAMSDKEIKDQNIKIKNTDRRILQAQRLQKEQTSLGKEGVIEKSAKGRKTQSGQISKILDEGAGRTASESIKAIPGDLKKVKLATQKANKSFGNFIVKQKGMSRGAKIFARGMNVMKTGAIGAAGGVRVLGAAVLNAIPVIGQIIFVVSLLFEAFKFLTKNEALDNYKDKLKELDTVLDGVAAKTDEFNRVNEKVKDPFQRLVASYAVASGLIDETVTKLGEVLDAQKKIDEQKRKDAETPWYESTMFSISGNIQENIAKAAGVDDASLQKALGVTIPLNFEKSDRDTFEDSGSFKLLAELREGPKIIQDVLNSKLDLTELIAGGADTDTILEAVNKALRETRETLKTVGPALQDLQSEFKNTENVMSSFFQKAFPKTKFDETAKQLDSLVNSFDAVKVAIGGAFNETGEDNSFVKNMDLSGVSDELTKQFAEATSGGGKQLQSLIPKELQDVDTDLISNMEQRDEVAARIEQKEKRLRFAYGANREQIEQSLFAELDILNTLDDKVEKGKKDTTLKAQALKILKDDFSTLQKTARENASLNKAATNRIKLLKKASKFQGALNFTLLEQNSINERNRDALNNEINLLQTKMKNQTKGSEEQAQTQAYLNSLIVQRDQAQESILTKEQIQYRLKEASVKLAREELKIEKERATAILSNAKNELAILQYKRTGKTDLDPEQSFKMEVQAAKDKRDMAIDEINLRMAMLDVEAKIVQARLLATATEIRAKDPQGAALLEAAGRDVVANTGKARAALQASITNISSSFEAEITNAMVKSLSGANTAQAVANVQTLIAERGSNAFNKVVEDAASAMYSKSIKAGLSEENSQIMANIARKDAEAATGEGSADQAKKEAEKLTIGDASSMLGPQIEALSKLGPEGELVAAATSGVLNIASAFSVLGDSGASAGAKAAAGMQVLSSINNIMQANAKAQQAALDTEINAEKKRDGKSKESVAKIAAMEKKKEAIAKKAFERNKKMQIASAIVDTASAVVGALGAKPWTPANIALAAAMGAMGMMQVALIQKQQFQGGGGGDQPAVQNTALTIGGRSNAVDTSQKASSGELAYLRGGQGVGTNANNFTPGGAMGRKGYANGGDGIVVGERGPEVISPSSPIDITPSYALGGQAQNINFNISAVDGASVQNMLNEQQGNIIQMIRDAANDNGEAFLETVDPTVYNGTGG